MFAKAVVLFASVYACTAHLCMLSPQQRTPLKDLNKAGSDSCILLDKPCGKTKPTTPKLTLVGGSNFTVIFQKNLDHFNSTSPGYWSVAIAPDEGSSFKELYHAPDTSTPSLTLYIANIAIPEPVGHKPVKMVLQSRYVTKNPKAPPVFYQCSDIIVRKGN